MPKSAHDISDGSLLETEVAVVGAGPAGLTVARGLRQGGHEVLVLEAGGVETSVDPDVGLVEAPDDVYDLRRSHFRGVGGSSTRWYRSGWKARPLDPEDFEARAHVAESGWPIGLDSLWPDYEDAARICEIPGQRYEGSDWPEIVAAKDLPGAPDLTYPLFQLGPYGNFLRLAEGLERGGEFELLTGAKVVGIDHEDGRFVRGLRAVGAGGRRFRVEAKCYVLANGGFDVPRLLLASSLGNEHDLVGRYFQEHLQSSAGYIVLDDPSRASRLGGTMRLQDGTKHLVSLALSARTRAEHGLLGCVLWLAPMDRAERSPAARAVDAFRGRWVVDQRLPHDWPERAFDILRDPRPLVRKLALKLGALSPERILSIDFEAESEPDANSRVVLTDERDAEGMPKATLQWKLSSKDRWSIRENQLRIGQALEAAGFGRLVEPFGDERRSAHLGGAAHHMGTTRMHVSPEKGVVDPDARLHRCQNLWVAGSSVFPTSGAANPTLTIVALAHRLARHLNAELVPRSVLA